MHFIRLKVSFIISIVILLNLVLLSNSQVCVARYFSLELYCIGNSDSCDNPADPFDESPYIGTVNVSFFVAHGLFV